MSPSLFQLLVVVLLIVVLFGRGKISGVMGDLAKGIKSFKRGLNDDSDEGVTTDRKTIEERSAGKSEARLSSSDKMHAG